MKQTAVEWLFDEIEKHYIINNGSLNPIIIMELKRQAKAQEKEQIINALGVGCQIKPTGLIGYYEMSEEYYNETYGK